MGIMYVMDLSSLTVVALCMVALTVAQPGNEISPSPSVSEPCMEVREKMKEAMELYVTFAASIRDLHSEDCLLKCSDASLISITPHRHAVASPKATLRQIINAIAAVSQKVDSKPVFCSDVLVASTAVQELQNVLAYVLFIIAPMFLFLGVARSSLKIMKKEGPRRLLISLYVAGYMVAVFMLVVTFTPMICYFDPSGC